MKENIYGVSVEVLKHYKKMNWKVRQSLLNTSVTLGLGPDFVKKGHRNLLLWEIPWDAGKLRPSDSLGPHEMEFKGGCRHL